MATKKLVQKLVHIQRGKKLLGVVRRRDDALEHQWVFAEQLEKG
jgi:hypothetical protein